LRFRGKFAQKCDSLHLSAEGEWKMGGWVVMGHRGFYLGGEK